MLAGLVFSALLPLLQASARAGLISDRWLLAFVAAIGLALRLLMFPTEPALEDDQQRYLWEGALVANGLSPYRIAPSDAKVADRTTLLGRLAEQSGPVIERVNHPHLKTIYPPAAQAAFTLAYAIKPFSLTAWRLVLLTADFVTLGLLLLLLADAGRPSLWVALYWWNPLVIKEVFNSGHMEGVLVMLILLASALAIRQRFVTASAALGLAIGVKIWPILLAPLLLRPIANRPREAILPLLVLSALCALWLWPIVAGGLDERSGFVVFAQRWQANGALLPALRDLLAKLIQWSGGSGDVAGTIARLMLAGSAAAAALWINRKQVDTAADLLRRLTLLTLVIFLLSPAQFPWYAIWTLPFLPFAPRYGVVAFAVAMPVYYASFYFAAIDNYAVFRDRVVWLIWLPLWGLLLFDAWQSSQGRRAVPSSSTSKHGT